MAVSSPPWLSVIVPALQEAGRIDACLRRLVASEGVDEVLVVDGGSTDDTVARAGAVPGVRTLRARRAGRGRQLNLGARHALGEALLFLHVDCRLPPDAGQRIRESLSQPGVVGGAFWTRHVVDGPTPRWIRPLLPLADLRSHYTRHPYGDQALFVRAETFRRVGGFSPIALMEVVDLSRRLWRVGRLHIHHDAVEVSARRYAARPIHSAVVMNSYPVLWRLGVPERVLARWYGSAR